MEDTGKHTSRYVRSPGTPPQWTAPPGVPSVPETNPGASSRPPHSLASPDAAPSLTPVTRDEPHLAQHPGNRTAGSTACSLALHHLRGEGSSSAHPPVPRGLTCAQGFRRIPGDLTCTGECDAYWASRSLTYTQGSDGGIPAAGTLGASLGHTVSLSGSVSVPSAPTASCSAHSTEGVPRRLSGPLSAH